MNIPASTGDQLISRVETSPHKMKPRPLFFIIKCIPKCPEHHRSSRHESACLKIIFTPTKGPQGMLGDEQGVALSDKKQQRMSYCHWGLNKMVDTLQMTFSNEFWWMKNLVFLFQASLKFVPESPIYNKSALLQIMAWHLTGNKPLPDMMTKFYNILWHQQATNC